jgi:glycosyltransferase involved in cell wall biosynthesis
VEDGLTGFVCEPSPESMALAMRRLVDDPSLAERMGIAAHAAGTRLTWPDTIRKLVVQ